MKISWLKDGSPINSIANSRVFQNIQDNSLQIAGPIPLDSGTFTCVASNGVDTDTADATLRVQDRPDHPHIVTLMHCRSEEATVTWNAGANNNAPITGYVVQYQTEKDKSMWYTVEMPEGKETETQLTIP